MGLYVWAEVPNKYVEVLWNEETTTLQLIKS